METPTVPRAETAADAGTMWRIDPGHSTIGFSVRHMMFTTVRGRFGGFRGTIRFDGARPRDMAVEAEIDAATIDTGITKRDEHLRSDDFFDVVAYPVIVFRSTRVLPATPDHQRRWTVVGDLTMHGVTRDVELAAEQVGARDRHDMEVVAFTVTARINRKDFGMVFNLPIEGGGLVVGDEVRIAMTIQAYRITA